MNFLNFILLLSNLLTSFFVIYSKEITPAIAHATRTEKKEIIATEGVKKTQEITLKEYGLAYLQRVRNNTSNDIKISAPNFLNINKRTKKYENEIIVAPNQTEELSFDPIIKKSKIRIEGYSKRNLTGLVSGSSISVSGGYAWLDESLSQINKGTISFQAKPTENISKDEFGEIVIVFSDEISSKFEWKIVIGANKNTESYILKRNLKTKENEIVYKVLATVNKFAAVKPEISESYWVSVNNGLVLVGQGLAGQNIFMSFFDEDLNLKINRVGLGANLLPVQYSNIQLSPAMVLQGDWQPYFESKKIDVKTKKNNYEILKTPLRVPGQGCFSFETKGENGLSVAFGDNFEYEFLIGADANSRTILRKNGEIVASVLATVNQQIVLSDSEKFNRYWISIDNGFILFGKNNPGENLMFAWKDPDPLKISNQIAVGLSESFGIKNTGEIFCKDIKIGLPVGLVIDFNQKYYQKTQALFEYPDSFTVISPFIYELFQDRPNVGVKDLIFERNYILLKVEEKDTKYFLMLDIESDGTPKFIKTKGPEPTQKKAEMQREAFIEKSVGETAIRVSEDMSWAGTGRGQGAIIARIGGEVFKGIGSMLSSKSDTNGLKRLSFQGPGIYAFVSGIGKTSFAQTEISEQAESNKKQIKEILEKIDLKQDPNLILSAYSLILDLITYPQVIEDSSLQEKIMSAVNFAYNTGLNQQQDDEYYKKLLKLLISAKDNPYLFDISNEKGKKQKEQWYFDANEIARYLINKFNKSEEGIGVPPLYGEYFWLPVELSKQTKTISFEAKTLNDINICFSPKKVNVRNSNVPIYEIVIRGWNGTASVIRTKSLGAAVAEYKHLDAPENTDVLDPDTLKNLAQSFKFRQYKITLDDGHIIVYEDDNKILDWQDSYPVKNIEYVGIGSWDVFVYYKNIKVS